MSQRRIRQARKQTVDFAEKNNHGSIVESWVDEVKRIWSDNWKFLGVLLFLIVGLYANSLNGDFVSDDYASLTQNPQMNDFWFMFNGGNSMSFGNYLVYKVFGYSSSVPFHLFGVLHMMVFCLLAFFLLEIIINNKIVSRMAMMLFAVHPIHVEAVAWISGRVYVILGIYLVLGLTAFVLYAKYNQPKLLWISLISFVLAFLTDKPRPFSLFLLIFLYLASLGFEKVRFNWLKLYVALSIVAIVFLLISWPYIDNRIKIVNGGYNASESIFYNPFFQYPTGLSKYFQLLWMPFDLTLYHTMYVFPAWLNWSILLTFLLMVGYFYFTNRVYFWTLSFMVAAVLPSIMPIKVSWLVAERYMFLGSLGFCAFLALLIYDMSRFFRYVPGVMFGGLLIFYSVRLVTRNADWRTNHSLWVNTCYVSPNSHNAWNNIGDDYDKRQDYVNAVKGFSQSTLVKPNYADAYHNRANILYKIGRLDLARESYGIAISLSPQLTQSYLSLVQIDLAEGKLDLAKEHAMAALTQDPGNIQAAYVYGAVLAENGEKQGAIEQFQKILSRYPDYGIAKQALLQIQQSNVAQ